MLKNSIVLIAILFHSAFSFAGESINWLYEYELPLIVVKGNAELPTQYTKCTVASFTFEGARYYRMILASPALAYPLLASAQTGRGIYTADRFSYEDIVPAFMNGAVTKIKNSTDYILDKDQRIIRSEMKATALSGEVIYEYVCQDKNFTS